MGIKVRANPDDRVLELGGGARPMVVPACLGGRDLNVDVRMCHDDQGRQTVDFVADLNAPLPVRGDEWDAVFSHFVLEHVSWRNVRGLVKEMYRVCKPGGRAVCVTANTEAQIVYCANHAEGWGGHDVFDSFSQVLFGDNDYPENTHRNFLNPTIAKALFEQAGFADVEVSAYGETQTDMVIVAGKPVTKATGHPEPDEGVGLPAEDKVRDFFPSEPAGGPAAGSVILKTVGHRGTARLTADGALEETVHAAAPPETAGISSASVLTREEMFDRHYFGGGGKVGGYAREGYWDYPVHEVTANHVLDRRPESVLELGCARGYVLKRIQDAGVRAAGLEVSKHCYLTRVADGVIPLDLCSRIWNIDSHPTGPSYDLCYSVATLEHIPEEFIGRVIENMVAHCRRGLHGVDFGEKDDGFDKTHCLLRDRAWWVRTFNKHAPGWPVEVVDKEELERGAFPEAARRGDGKVKLNVGSYITMYHHGWVNVDVHDLGAWAQGNGYNYLRHDARNGLPYGTGEVDLIMVCHMLEHLTYEEGLAFLRECRRVLKEGSGAMRVIVPDAHLLINSYASQDKNWGQGLREVPPLGHFDEVNDGCAAAPTALAKLWSLTVPGHQAGYDWPTLEHYLREAGLDAFRVGHREAASGPGRQILRETLDLLPCLSLYAEARPPA